MTTRSGAQYNPMGDLQDDPSSSNPTTNPLTNLFSLKNMISELALEMRTQIHQIKEDLRGSQALTNRRLNELEHPAIQPQMASRNPTSKLRPTTPQGYRPTPPTPPPEYRTPPQYEYRIVRIVDCKPCFSLYAWLNY